MNGGGRIHGHSSVKASHGNPMALQSMDNDRYGTKKKNNFLSGSQDIDDYAEKKGMYKKTRARG